jgi:hypothetical protein
MLLTKSKKKNEEVQERALRAERYDCVVKVGINGFEGEAILRNISSGGFLMESRTYAAITVGGHYTLQIKPYANSGLKLFELEVEVRWIKSTETKFSAGFLVIIYPADRSFDKYLDYVKNQNRN